MWFVELNGRMDDRVVGRQSRRPHHARRQDHRVPDSRAQGGSPINIAVGPDRNIWFTKAGKLGRVTPDGVITEFDLPTPAGGPTGLTAGSDRRPPDRLIDKLWFTGRRNKLAFLRFTQ